MNSVLRSGNAASLASPQSSQHPGGAPVLPSTRHHGHGGQPLDRNLSHALDACSLAHMKESFRNEAVTYEDLVRATPEWLRTWFPEIRAGPASRLLAYAAAHPPLSQRDASTLAPGTTLCGHRQSLLLSVFRSLHPPYFWPGRYGAGLGVGWEGSSLSLMLPTHSGPWR